MARSGQKPRRAPRPGMRDASRAGWEFFETYTRDLSRREMRRHMRELQRDMRRGDVFIPADWKLQPEDPNFSGRRYMAPDGSAWLALYSAPADKVNVAVHLKNGDVIELAGTQMQFVQA